MIKPSVSIYILSRDRVEMCREAVASALAQTYSNLKIILSDNSAGSQVSEMMKNEFPYVDTIRRTPQLAAIDHFNMILGEVNSDFLVMFHDDDVLLPHYVESMVEYALDDSRLVAVACNAYLIYGRNFTSHKIMEKLELNRQLTSPVELLESYLSLGNHEAAPFPGYMYRTSKIKNLQMDYKKGGKYCDVSFLCQVCEIGPILWLPNCFFRYRIHSANDSKSEAVENRLSLMRYIQSKNYFKRRDNSLMDYRFLYWRRWLMQRPSNAAINHRFFVVKRFVRRWGVRVACTRYQFWVRSFRFIVRSLKIRDNKL